MKKSFGPALLLLMILFFPLFAQAESISELERKIKELEKEIETNQTKAAEKEAKAGSIEKEIRRLQREIITINARIKQTELLIEKTEANINETSDSIGLLNKRIENSKAILAEQIRFISRSNHISLFERLLAQDNLSRVFDSVANVESVQKRLYANLLVIKAGKQALETEKQALEEQQEEQNNLRRLNYNQKKDREATKQTEDIFLRNTKKEKEAYKSLVTGAQAEITNIRARIRLLQSGGRSLGFEEALDIAKYAESLTGVRAALLLSVLWQESNFNSNVGECDYKIALRGNEDWANKQRKLFEQITREVGRDPDKTLVSCPLPDSKGGYLGSGGAMGPAQFIPSTWAAYKDNIGGLIGHSPDPWNVTDAIVAMAVLLKANGAPGNERRAAGAYFGKCQFGFVAYCDQVLARAKAYQSEIDKIVLNR